MPGPLPRIAIVSCSEQQRMNLGRILASNDLQVVLNQSPSHELLTLAREHKAEVLLIDLGDDACFDEEVLASLLGQNVLPMLFNDSAATRFSAGMPTGDWGRRLARKLAVIAAETRSQLPVSTLLPRPVATPVSAQSLGSGVLPAAVDVWVLCASIGGPHALKKFLAALAPGLPLAFILAQHIGIKFIALLARQLNQVSDYQVLPVQAGATLCQRQVVLAPVDEEIDFDSAGCIRCTPVAENDVLYRPSIDSVLAKVARRYGKGSGAIIFSGMGNDGAEGVRAIAAQGGEVWAQDYASCLVSSMPDQARLTRVVSFSGTPEILAQRLSQRYATSVAAVAHPLPMQQERTA
ncbi:MAG: chemotaxis protein CheB [Gammaproteobacteria bacterium]|nr:chemotaxis protein CheB [Gammaproteobacteria bacterium]